MENVVIPVLHIDLGIGQGRHGILETIFQILGAHHQLIDIPHHLIQRLDVVTDIRVGVVQVIRHVGADHGSQCIDVLLILRNTAFAAVSIFHRLADTHSLVHQLGKLIISIIDVGVLHSGDRPDTVL